MATMQAPSRPNPRCLSYNDRTEAFPRKTRSFARRLHGRIYGGEANGHALRGPCRLSGIHDSLC
jgi:hypothetical protein